MSETNQPFEGLEEDPVYRHSLREARVILAVWCLCFFYTVTFCYLRGYLVHEPLASSSGPAVTQLLGPLESFNRNPQSLSYPLGLGIPDWVFYGIVVPWVLCLLFSFWYGFFIFTEDDLSHDEDHHDEDHHDEDHHDEGPDDEGPDDEAPA